MNLFRTFAESLSLDFAMTIKRGYYAVCSNHLSKIFSLVMICFLISSFDLAAQDRKFDPDGLVSLKLQEIQTLKKNDLLQVSKKERAYITINVDDLKSNIEKIKKSLTKAEALDREDEVIKLKASLSELRALRKSYTLILQKADSDI